MGLAAMIAAADLATQGGGAAVRDRAQGAPLHPGQARGGDERRGVGAHDVGELDSPRYRARPLRGSVHELPARALGAFEQLQRRGRGRQVSVGQVEVAQRRADVAVAHQPLDGVHVHARLQ